VSAITSLDLYHRFVELIDQACDAKDIYRVPGAAETYGLTGAEEQRGTGQRWNFSFVDAHNQEVLVHARWWDQSQAFSIRPDMHVISVELKGEATLMKHERRYEE
jgi:hypothetical protein